METELLHRHTLNVTQDISFICYSSTFVHQAKQSMFPSGLCKRVLWLLWDNTVTAGSDLQWEACFQSTLPREKYLSCIRDSSHPIRPLFNYPNTKSSLRRWGKPKSDTWRTFRTWIDQSTTALTAWGKEDWIMEEVEALLSKEWSVINQTNISTVSKDISGRLLRDRAEHVRAFLNTTMPPWVETGNWNMVNNNINTYNFSKTPSILHDDGRSVCLPLQ